MVQTAFIAPKWAKIRGRNTVVIRTKAQCSVINWTRVPVRIAIENTLNPPATGYTLPGVLFFLQSEWRKVEREKVEWELERAELKVGRINDGPENGSESRSYARIAILPPVQDCGARRTAEIGSDTE